ncbi:MAG: pilus assembly protein [Sporichthyaceae bacterium]|nr:pilus assembly protein [Sporichthyaceae bacterium]
MCGTASGRGPGGAANTAAPARPPSRRRGGRDRGDTLVEAILITPIMFFIVLVVIQFALWYHARQIVTAAAQEATRVARVATATPDQVAQAGQDRAYAFVETLGGGTVADPSVQVDRTATTVTVQVEASTLTIVPGLDLRATARSVSPVERFEPDS